MTDGQATTPPPPLDSRYRRSLGAGVGIVAVIIGGLCVGTALTMTPTPRPTRSTLQHASCAHPVGVRGGLNINNYILCDDGSRIPLNGATGSSRRPFGLNASDEAWRCAMIGRPVEVWTVAGAWPRRRIVQVACSGTLRVSYAQSVVPSARGATAVPRLFMLGFGLFLLIVFVGFLASLSARRHSTSGSADWYWPT